MFLEILKWYALSFAVGICTLIVTSVLGDDRRNRKPLLARHPQAADVSTPVTRVSVLVKPESSRRIKAA